jgi:hypothetical protein
MGISNQAQRRRECREIQGAIDARAFRESLLNKALPIINQEVDTWRAKQRGLLMDQIVDILTNPLSDVTGEFLSASIHGLDDRVRQWVDSKRAAIQSFARTRIVNEACENTVDLWAAEAVIHRIDARRRELDAQTDTSFDAAGIEKRRLNRLAELESLAAEHIAAEETRLQEMVATCIASLKHEAKVRLRDADDKLTSRSLTTAIRSGKPPKPLPISARTRSKKGAKRRNALDLSSQPSADSETPMTTDDETPASLALSATSPAEPTPKAAEFTCSTSPSPPPRPASPPSRPTSTTPTGRPGPTPPTEPASELTMVLAALHGMQASLSAEILKVNSRVDQLILNPPGLVPSSQPHEDYGDFALPTTTETREFGDWTQAPDDPSDPLFDQTMADDHVAQEALLFDLAKMLQSSGRTPPLKGDEDDKFATFLFQSVNDLGWGLTPATFSAEQLDHLGRLWTKWITNEDEADKPFHDAALFDDLFGSQAPRSKTDPAKFTDSIDRFCTHYKKKRPLAESDYVFVKEFLTRPQASEGRPATAPNPGKSRIRFSEPPIATINPSLAADPTLPGPEEFPALAGKPFGDTWTTVAKKGKKKKAANAQSPQHTGAPTSFAATAASTVALTTSQSTPPPPPKSKPQPLKPRTPDALRTTRYSIILNHSRPDIRELLSIDASRIFRTIRADLEKINAPLTLLAGHWSSAVINKNFILTFAGIQKRDDIAKYDSVLFRPFGPGCCGAPTAGYRSVLLSGVPLIRDTSGRLPSPAELDREVGRNAAFKGVLSLAPPRWLFNPANIEPDRRASSVIIAFYDPDGKTFNTITNTRNAVAMFGSFVKAQAFENRPSFSQCTCCLRLGHIVERCNRPSSLVVCPHCGGPHSAAQHAFRCPRSQNHRGRQCSCPPHCFLCVEKKMKGKGEGHNALSRSCPLHEQYRVIAPTPRRPDSDGDIIVPDAPTPSDAETLPPTPGASGPFTMVLEDRSASLITLHKQGASTDELCRSLLSAADLADLTPHLNE